MGQVLQGLEEIVCPGHPLGCRVGQSPQPCPWTSARLFAGGLQFCFSAQGRFRIFFPSMPWLVRPPLRLGVGGKVVMSFLGSEDSGEAMQ